MILTLARIMKEVQFENGLDLLQANPHSVDLRTDTGGALFVLPSGQTALLRTLDKVKLSDRVMGVVYPRSSSNRRGLMVHMTGVVDAGYEGTLVVPVTNTTDKDIMILQGERICSIVFEAVFDRVEFRESKYHNGDGSFVPDKEEEQAFLERNDIKSLKEKYKII